MQCLISPRSSKACASSASTAGCSTTSGPQRAGPPRPGLGPSRPLAAVLLLRSREGRATQARPPHRAAALDHLPGDKSVTALAGAGGGRRRLVAGRPAWRWSTCRARPTPTSRVSTPAPSSWSAVRRRRDLVRDLIQLFEACWDDDQWAMHLEAAKHTHLGLRRAPALSSPSAIRRGGTVRRDRRCRRRSWTTSPTTA